MVEKETLAQELQRVTAERDAAVALQEQAVKGLDESNKALADLQASSEGLIAADELNAKIEDAKAAGFVEGEKAAREQIEARVSEYGAAFALEHLTDSDADCKAAYIEHLKAENAKLREKAAQDETGLDMDAENGQTKSEPKSFDALRKQLIADGMSARDAAVEARKRFGKK